jgi:hypothetical protein
MIEKICSKRSVQGGFLQREVATGNKKTEQDTR